MRSGPWYSTCLEQQVQAPGGRISINPCPAGGEQRAAPSSSSCRGRSAARQALSLSHLPPASFWARSVFSNHRMEDDRCPSMGGSCGCSDPQCSSKQHFQQRWHGFPADYFLNFLSRIFVLCCSLGVNSCLPITFLIGKQFFHGCSGKLIPPLSWCSAPSPVAVPKPRRWHQERAGGIASPGPGFSTQLCIFAAAGFLSLCFLVFSTPGEIYCCKAPWAHWQGKTITQHFQSQKSVIVIYLCAAFQPSPTAIATAFQPNTGTLMRSLQCTLREELGPGFCTWK